MKSSTHKALRAVYATISLGAVSLGMVSVLLTPVFTIPVQADIYHAVEAGESLASVAKRYNVTPQTLRDINQLGNISENSALASMLLRVPGEGQSQSKAQTATKKVASKPSTKAAPKANYSGSVTKYISYKVQPGDTVESLAASFSQSGQKVSAGEIRRKNNISDQPDAGSTLLIPATTIYSASAQMNPSSRNLEIAADRGDIGVSVSEEVALPFARAIPTAETSGYQAPNSSTTKTVIQKTPVVSRGNLSGRGGFPSPNVDGARILQPGEELLTTPSPRVRSTPTATGTNTAKVARISTAGARIRRLPDASAVTLYKCATGTEIAVTAQRNGWSAILMSDRSTGWIPSRNLKLTGASVDIASQVETNEESRGDDTASGWKSGYSSNHPAVRNALTYMGTRYVYGGTSRRGIDCSSLVQHAYRTAGVRLPRTAAQQARVGKPVATENLQPGDRLYFSASGRRIDHTGLYMGNGLFVHASGSARKVTVSKLSDRRLWNIYVGARR